jgi:putative chitinase
MYNITPDILRKVAGVKASRSVVEGLAKYIPEVLPKYGITTKRRLAHFLAQISHETDHFKTLEEYASGRAYEGRRDLGNKYRGDGARFKGRGAIQITGRYNYTKYGDILGIDLVGHPELALEPRYSLEIAAAYWRDRGLNALADADNVKQITRKINGGYNGLDDRIASLRRAKAALADLQDVVDKPLTRVVKVAAVEPEVEPEVPETEPIIEKRIEFAQVSPDGGAPEPGSAADRYGTQGSHIPDEPTDVA